VPKTFFITTAIDYTNSPPHIGHAYEKVLADVIARYHRLKGEDVFFLTGADQHGQKVQQSAAKAGVSPSEFVKGVTQKFKDLYQKLDVKYDDWAETISPRHKTVVQGMLRRLFEEGQVYKDKQSGHYSVRQEQFLTDKERGPDGEFGPEWGEVEFREEENYYFKLSQHKEWLLRYIDNRKDAVIPDFRRTELRNAVEKLSGDLCISRPKSRLDWGIELPFDNDFVTYVWFDALTNYISFAGYDPNIDNYAKQQREFLDRWPALQIIGKDILVPAHGIYWLIMLHALGFPDDAMPQLLVHGFWNMGGAKMSKSLGNIVDPNILADKYGADAVRYYLCAAIDTGQDSDFSESQLVKTYNGRLANNIGNLLNRVLNMVHRYCDGKSAIGYEQARNRDAKILPFLESEYLDRGSHDRYRFWMNEHRPAGALEEIDIVATACNELIEQRAPWTIAKDTNKKTELDGLLVLLADALRVIAMRLRPVLPTASRVLLDQIDPQTRINRNFDLGGILFNHLEAGHVFGKPTPVFPRVEWHDML
jgi:methionyl-tRNA synthetase